jgi:serine/threonine protein kinase
MESPAVTEETAAEPGDADAAVDGARSEKAEVLHALDKKFVATGPVLGRGAFGVVRLGGVYEIDVEEDASTGTCAAVALKDIPMTKWRAVAREVIAMVRCLGHPNIVRLQGIRRLPPDLECPYERTQLVLDYAAGGNLAGVAASWAKPDASPAGHAVGIAPAGSNRRGGGGSETRSATGPAGLPECLARKYVRDLLEALACVHASGLAHCDVKGANLLLSSDGRALLSDFGSCFMERLLDGTEEQVAAYLAPEADAGATPASDAGLLFADSELSPQERGTLRWTPPELIGGAAGEQGRQPLSPLRRLQAADIWATGCTLLEMLTGTPPWWWLAADSADVMVTLLSTDVRSQLPPWLSPQCADFVLRCLHPDAAARSAAAALLQHPFIRQAPPLLPLAAAPAHQLEYGLASGHPADQLVLEQRSRRFVTASARVAGGLAGTPLSAVPMALPLDAGVAAAYHGGSAVGACHEGTLDVASSAKYAVVALAKLASVATLACRTVQRRLEATAAAAAAVAAATAGGTRFGGSAGASTGASAGAAGSLEWMAAAAAAASVACACRSGESVRVAAVWRVWEQHLLADVAFRDCLGGNSELAVTEYALAARGMRAALFGRGEAGAARPSSGLRRTSSDDASLSSSAALGREFRLPMPHADDYGAFVFGGAQVPQAHGREAGGASAPASAEWLALIAAGAEALAACLANVKAAQASSHAAAVSPAAGPAHVSPLERECSALAAVLKALVVARVRAWQGGDGGFDAVMCGWYSPDCVPDNAAAAAAAAAPERAAYRAWLDDTDGRAGLLHPTESARWRCCAPSDAKPPSLSLRGMYLLSTWLGCARRGMLLGLPFTGALWPGAALQPVPFDASSDAVLVARRAMATALVMPRLHAWIHELAAMVRVLWLLQAAAGVPALSSPVADAADTAAGAPPDLLLLEAHSRVAACWAWVQQMWVHSASVSDMRWSDQLLLLPQHVRTFGGDAVASAGGGSRAADAEPAAAALDALLALAADVDDDEEAGDGCGEGKADGDDEDSDDDGDDGDAAWGASAERGSDHAAAAAAARKLRCLRVWGPAGPWLSCLPDMHVLSGQLRPGLLAAEQHAAPEARAEAAAHAAAATATAAVDAAQACAVARLSEAQSHYCAPYGPAATVPWQSGVRALHTGLHMAIADFTPGDDGGAGSDGGGGAAAGCVPLSHGDVVLCVCEDDSGWWCVRRLTRDMPFLAAAAGAGRAADGEPPSGGLAAAERFVEGWVPAAYLCRISFPGSSR